MLRKPSLKWRRKFRIGAWLSYRRVASTGYIGNLKVRVADHPATALVPDGQNLHRTDKGNETHLRLTTFSHVVNLDANEDTSTFQYELLSHN